MTETKSTTIFGINEKYNRIERVTDKQGRILGFKNLLPAERKEVEAMTPGLDGTTISKIRYKDEDGVDREQEIDVPKRVDFFLAAALREVDGRPMLFPQNRRELNAVLNALDDDGLSAALEAYGKLNPAPVKDENAPPLDIIEQAKN